MDTEIAKCRWNKQYNKAENLLDELTIDQSELMKYKLQKALLLIERSQLNVSERQLKIGSFNKNCKTIIRIATKIQKSKFKEALILTNTTIFTNSLHKYECLRYTLKIQDKQLDSLDNRLKTINEMISRDFNLEEDLATKIFMLINSGNKESAIETYDKFLEYFPKSSKKKILKTHLGKLSAKTSNSDKTSDNLKNEPPMDLSELNDFIGLDNVKSIIRRMIQLLEYNRQRSELLNLPKRNTKFNLNFVFKGNPGTGKTTVARVIGNILKEHGILKSDKFIEVDRSDLVAKYIGQSEAKTKNIINEAIGGVLFIDEAYSLYKSDSNTDFGNEVIDLLTKEIEDKKGELCVIFAGYPKEMDEFLSSNIGLSSRIGYNINFEDYNNSDLLKIATKMARDKHYKITKAGKVAIKEKLNVLKLNDSFGNARAVESIISQGIADKALKFSSKKLTRKEFTYLDSENFGSINSIKRDKMMNQAMKELDNLIGLDEVKEEIYDIRSMVNYNNRLKDNNMIHEEFSNHMVFKGNPGTGKTTVAKILGRIFNAMGLLKKGQFINADRESLISSKVGHTATKTKNLIKKAIGGVLFIDEAYSLVRGPSDAGLQAIDTLIKEMEEHRSNLVVILAGYDKEMDDLLATNPGFKSRINNTLVFDDYTVDELFKIFMLRANNRKYKITVEAKKELRKYIERMHTNKDAHFGNGREIRKLFDEVIKEIANRAYNGDVPDNELKLIIANDIREV